MRNIMRLSLALFLFAAMPLAGAAHVVYVYEGSDYAYVNSAHTQVTVCDQETDDNPAYANYTRTGSSSVFRVDDPNGSQPGCGQTTHYYYILAFRVCEGVFGPDPCSSWAIP